MPFLIHSPAIREDILPRSVLFSARRGIDRGPQEHVSAPSPFAKTTRPLHNPLVRIEIVYRHVPFQSATKDDLVPILFNQFG